MSNQEWWLDFDHAKFEDWRGEDNFYGFLNVQVKNDNSGGNSEKTVIVFDMDGYGGSEAKVEASGFPEDYDFTSGKITITLYGGMEAGAFFSAMKNLVTTYELKTKLGD